MGMPELVQPLPAGPLDIIGDIHGEIDALRRLLARLGVDPARGTAQRPVAFVGDLVDRGPDSPAVVRLVRDLVRAGVGHCIAGNHELNLLTGDHKEGNGWFFGHNDGYHWVDAQGQGHLRPFESVAVTDPAERRSIRDFLASLPLALVREDLRIVHACWDAPSLARLPPSGDLARLTEEAARTVLTELQEAGVLARAAREREQFADLRDPTVRPDRPLPAVQQVSAAEQIGNPYKVLTSGREEPIPLEELFYVGGKWRFVTRSAWWNHYRDEPAVVVGHYWRRRAAPVHGKVDTWNAVPPFGWAGPRGNVFCVDYSVGRRFLERWQREETGESGSPERWIGSLAALRWPERVLVFDDQDEPVPTVAFGGAG